MSTTPPTWVEGEDLHEIIKGLFKQRFLERNRRIQKLNFLTTQQAAQRQKSKQIK